MRLLASEVPQARRGYGSCPSEESIQMRMRSKLSGFHAPFPLRHSQDSGLGICLKQRRAHTILRCFMWMKVLVWNRRKVELAWDEVVDGYGISGYLVSTLTVSAVGSAHRPEPPSIPGYSRWDSGRKESVYRYTSSGRMIGTETLGTVAAWSTRWT
jgi:hypothetical protein